MSKIALISVYDRNSGTTELVMVRPNGVLTSFGFEASAWNVEMILRAYDPNLSVAAASLTSKTNFKKTVKDVLNTLSDEA